MEFDLMELKAQRIRSDKTQAEVANYLGIRPVTYTKKENGNIKITMEEFEKICNFLKVKDITIFFKNSVDKKLQ